MEVILKTLDENFIKMADFTMLSGIDVYKVGQIFFSLGKKLKK